MERYRFKSAEALEQFKGRVTSGHSTVSTIARRLGDCALLKTGFLLKKFNDDYYIVAYGYDFMVDFTAESVIEYLYNMNSKSTT